MRGPRIASSTNTRTPGCSPGVPHSGGTRKARCDHHPRCGDSELQLDAPIVHGARGPGPPVSHGKGIHQVGLGSREYSREGVAPLFPCDDLVMVLPAAHGRLVRVFWCQGLPGRRWVGACTQPVATCQ